MGKKLAIRGHSTRGKKVIELLEMLGGKKISNITGDNLELCYLIDDENDIVRQSIAYEDDRLNIFTLEEFWEKYPFKIGDKVTNGFDFYTIKSMSWCADYETMVYSFEDSVIVLAAEDMKPVNEDKAIDNPMDTSHFMQLGKIAAVCFNTENYENEVELKLGDYEIVVRDGKTYAAKKKPKYPKTYEECCKVLRISPEFLIKYSVDGNDTERDAPLIKKFIKLKRCRDAYWEIAGKEMGLSKPWDSTHGCGEWGYWIGYDINENKIYLQDSRILINCIFVFPTKEMRDAFYENFKDLIERCKELL